MLLIVTTKDDLAIDYFLTKLTRSSLPAFRMNVDDLFDAKIVWANHNDPERTEIGIGNRVFSIGEITSVLYRRALTPRPPEFVNADARNFAAGEVRHLYEGLLQGLESARWVSGIQETHAAERKLYQLQVAERIGLEVPDTIVSNDESTIRGFVEYLGGRGVCKPIYHGLWRSSQGMQAIHTRFVDFDNLPTQEELDTCPVLIQEVAPKGTDIRITCIGDELFPVEIQTAQPDLIDWRHPDHELEYQTTELPNRIQSLVCELLSHLKLQYGAMDFVRTLDGRWLFLEVNPVGEWVWLERHLSLPMSDAFIRLLFPQIPLSNS